MTKKKIEFLKDEENTEKIKIISSDAYLEMFRKLEVNKKLKLRKICKFKYIYNAKICEAMWWYCYEFWDDNF